MQNFTGVLTSKARHKVLNTMNDLIMKGLGTLLPLDYNPSYTFVSQYYLRGRCLLTKRIERKLRMAAFKEDRGELLSSVT